jgi:hypothetical protein
LQGVPGVGSRLINTRDRIGKHAPAAEQDARGVASLGLGLTALETAAPPDCADVRCARQDSPMLFTVLGSAAREFRDVLRAATPTHRRLRDHFVTIIVVTVGVDLVCAIAAFVLERHSQQTEIKTLGSAAFWTTTQLLTVSSSIKNPISFGGRILDIFMEIYAITVIATLAGSIGSFLQKRGQEIEAKR